MRGQEYLVYNAKPKSSANLLFYFVFYYKIPLGVSVIFILQLAYDRRGIKWSAPSLHICDRNTPREWFQEL